MQTNNFPSISSNNNRETDPAEDNFAAVRARIIAQFEANNPRYAEAQTARGDGNQDPQPRVQHTVVQKHTLRRPYQRSKRGSGSSKRLQERWQEKVAEAFRGSKQSSCGPIRQTRLVPSTSTSSLNREEARLPAWARHDTTSTGSVGIAGSVGQSAGQVPAYVSSGGMHQRPGYCGPVQMPMAPRPSTSASYGEGIRMPAWASSGTVPYVQTPRSTGQFMGQTPAMVNFGGMPLADNGGFGPMRSATHTATSEFVGSEANPPTQVSGDKSPFVGQVPGLANPQPIQWSRDLQPIQSPASAPGFDSGEPSKCK